MRKIEMTNESVKSVLNEMLDYALERLNNGEDISGYLSEIINTGLFNDACGKVIDYSDGKWLIAEEY